MDILSLAHLREDLARVAALVLVADPLISLILAIDHHHLDLVELEGVQEEVPGEVGQGEEEEEVARELSV